MNMHHLVLLPGLDSTGQLFAPLPEKLPSEFTATVVCYPSDESLSDEQLNPFVQL